MTVRAERKHFCWKNRVYLWNRTYIFCQNHKTKVNLSCCVVMWFALGCSCMFNRHDSWFSVFLSFFASVSALVFSMFYKSSWLSKSIFFVQFANILFLCPLLMRIALRKKWKPLTIVTLKSFHFLSCFIQCAGLVCPTPYPLPELKPHVLLLYTNSIVLKKLISACWLLFFIVRQEN
jgi:hypothetical protein